MKPRFTLFERLVLMCLIAIWQHRQHVYEWESYTIKRIHDMIGLTADYGESMDKWEAEQKANDEM